MINVSIPSSDFTRSVVTSFADSVKSISLNHTTWIGKVNYSSQQLWSTFMLSIKALQFGNNLKIRFLIPFSQRPQGGCFHSGCWITLGTIREALNKTKIHINGKCDWTTLNRTDWNMTILTCRWAFTESRILITLPAFTTVSGSFRRNCSIDSFLPKCHIRWIQIKI